MYVLGWKVYEYWWCMCSFIWNRTPPHKSNITYNTETLYIERNTASIVWLNIIKTKWLHKNKNTASFQAREKKVVFAIKSVCYKGNERKKNVKSIGHCNCSKFHVFSQAQTIGRKQRPVCRSKDELTYKACEPIRNINKTTHFVPVSSRTFDSPILNHPS